MKLGAGNVKGELESGRYKPLRGLNPYHLASLVIGLPGNGKVIPKIGCKLDVTANTRLAKIIPLQNK